MACLGSRDPLNFWPLNADGSKMTKDTNFKFGRHASRDSADRMPEKLFSKVGVAIVTWPCKLHGVKCYKMIEAMYVCTGIPYHPVWTSNLCQFRQSTYIGN